jgi:hypothetical protein
MDFISILATIILFTTVATLAVALAAYAAFKLREKRKPGKGGGGPGGMTAIEPMFLERYVPEGDEPQAAAEPAAQ